ncbi:MAG: sugar phosphate isomerase/epimerase family protein [Bryobacteraceae bacterium]
MIPRRVFLASAALAAAPAAERLPIRKSVLWSMLPSKLTPRERFELAKEVGFIEVEIGTVTDPAMAEEIRKASDDAKVPIHSIMNQAHWRYPLSSADPAVVEKSMEGMKTSLDNARLFGAETVLLVPAVVDAKTRYADAWTRSQQQIRKLIPLAAERKVIIAVEEVWNKFLLSPLEFARYVDDFNSPWVKAYFDVGNVVLTGFPQDWIRTLGKRIVKLHLKDFRWRQDPQTRQRVTEFVDLREGEVDWKEVYAALTEIGYRGSATVELRGGEKEYLAEVSRRVDQILTGA